jgi:hypothetical protein
LHDTLCSRCISTYEHESNYKYSSKYQKSVFTSHIFGSNPRYRT